MHEEIERQPVGGEGPVEVLVHGGRVHMRAQLLVHAELEVFGSVARGENKRNRRCISKDSKYTCAGREGRWGVIGQFSKLRVALNGERKEHLDGFQTPQVGVRESCKRFRGKKDTSRQRLLSDLCIKRWIQGRQNKANLTTWPTHTTVVLFAERWGALKEMILFHSFTIPAQCLTVLIKQRFLSESQASG